MLESMDNLTTLQEISLLDDDWDGFGALPVNPRTITFAEHLIKEVIQEKDFDLSPSNNGTLSFEWENSRLEAHLSLGSTQYSMYIASVDNSFDTLYFSGTLEELETNWSNIAVSLTLYK